LRDNLNYRLFIRYIRLSSICTIFPFIAVLRDIFIYHRSAQLISIILEHPGISQAETGRRLGIKQNSVSGRGNRAHLREILEVENTFRKRIKMYRHAGSD